MKKFTNFLLLLIICGLSDIVLAQTPWDGIVADKFAGGTGTQVNPYRIETPQQLAYLATQVNAGNSYKGKYFKLMANLDLGAAENATFRLIWTPIGNELNPFSGNFDGGGFEINNMYANQRERFTGLFGYVDAYPTNYIENLGIGSGSSVNGHHEVGGIAGYASNTSFTQCYNKGRVDGTGGYVGGITGRASASSITNCYNIGNVSGGSDYVGGLAGYSYNFSQCYNIGSVSGGRDYVGGLTGYSSMSSSESSFMNSYNIGDVSGDGNYIGGLSGYLSTTFTSPTSCYNIGVVRGGGNYVGGLVGYLSTTTSSSTSFLNSYNTGSVSGGENKIGGIAGASSSTTLFKNCYNIGSIKGMGTVSGISSGSKANCYQLVDRVSTDGGQSWGNGTNPAYVKSESQMKGDSLPVLLNKTTNVWFLDANINNSYPFLYYQIENIYWIDRAATAFSGGEGSKGAPYLISSAEELALLAKNVNAGTTYQGKYFKLTRSLDLIKFSNTENRLYRWTPIGITSNPFSGNFDGGGFEIDNMYLYENKNSVGLFGYFLGDSIKNLGIGSGSSVHGRNRVGGIVGYLSSSYFIRCYNKGKVSGDGNYVAGIASACYSWSSFTNCYNTGSVSGGGGHVGGIAASPTLTYLSSSTFTNCRNTGDVSGGKDYVGGLVGVSAAFFINCHNTGNISGGEMYVGGIAGASISFINCYNTGNVIGIGDRVGGITGSSHSSTFTQCYNTADVVTTTGDYAGGIVGIVEASSSSPVITDCYNTGNITSSLDNVAGIANSVITPYQLKNCYNIGKIKGGLYASAIAKEGGVNCYQLENVVSTDLGETWNNGHISSTVKTEAEMKENSMITLLNNESFSWVKDMEQTPINNHYPILRYQNTALPNYMVNISASTHGSFTVKVNGVEITDGMILDSATVLVLNAIPDTNCTFVKWWDDNTALSRNYTLTSHCKISAVFEKANDTSTSTIPKYTVNILAPNEGGSFTVKVEGVEIRDGAVLDSATILVLQARPDKGYIFQTWWDNNTEASRNYTLSEHLSIMANFTKGIDIESETSSANHKIYPNPAKEVLNIEFATDTKIHKIELLNSVGQSLLTKEFSSIPISEVLFIEKYERGSYFLKMYSPKGIELYKIIKR